MSENYRFDESINIKLRRDEAIVLAWYLTRELWNEGENNLRASFIHPSEVHSLEALLQELMRSSDEKNQILGIEITAREHLLKRFT